MQCARACPSGTLPSVRSLYYLNKHLFQDRELLDVFSDSSSYANQPSGREPGLSPIAIGLNQEAIYSPASLPYELVDGIPHFSGRKINLDCQVCIHNCSQCVAGYLLVLDTQTCILDQKCPKNYQLTVNSSTNQRQCQKFEETKQFPYQVTIRAPTLIHCLQLQPFYF